MSEPVIELPASAIPAAKPDAPVDGGNVAPPEAPKERASDKWTKTLRAERKAQEAREALSKKEADLKAREDAFKSREADITTREAKLKALREDPTAFTETTGLTYEEILNLYVNKGKLTPEMKAAQLEEKVTKLTKAQEEAARQQVEREISQTEEQKKQIIANYHADVMGKLGDAEGLKAYPMINALGKQNEVFTAIRAYIKNKNVIPKLEDIAKTIEDEAFASSEAWFLKNKDNPRLAAAMKKALGLTEDPKKPEMDPTPFAKPTPKAVSGAMATTSGQAERTKKIRTPDDVFEEKMQAFYARQAAGQK